MHYYKFHITDYRAATTHLSDMEDLCYRRLIDMYYDLEHEIPLETEWVAKRIRMKTENVDSVLNDMFERTENGWFNARCAAEIEAYHHRADVNKVNGGKGGRPSRKKRKPNGNPMATETKPTLVSGYMVNGSKEGECEREMIEAIYQAYPKKVGKHKALDSIEKALQKVDADTLLTAVKKYAISRRGEDAKYTPNPATWFNQGRWADGDGDDEVDLATELAGYSLAMPDGTEFIIGQDA